MSRAIERFELYRNDEGGICVRASEDVWMFVYPNDRYLSARLLFAMADALLCDAKAAPEPATAAVDAGALEALRVTVEAHDGAFGGHSAVPSLTFMAARLAVIEAARRLLEGGGQ